MSFDLDTLSDHFLRSMEHRFLQEQRVFNMHSTRKKLTRARATVPPPDGQVQCNKIRADTCASLCQFVVSDAKRIHTYRCICVNYINDVVISDNEHFG